MQSSWQDFLTDETGATVVEYGLIVSLVTIVLVVGLSQLGATSDGMWGMVSTKVGAALR